MFNTVNTTHKLTVEETDRKAGKYLYKVIEIATGKVVSTRTSNRKYVACSISGAFYFGRVDLIGKGNHGNALKFTNEQWFEHTKIIAYLEQ